MLRSLAVPVTLVALAGCSGLPPAPPDCASYEAHLALDPGHDEVLWIEVLHGAQARTRDGGLEFFEAFARGEPVHPVGGAFCLDLQGYEPLDGADGAGCDPTMRFLAVLAEHVEVLDCGLYAEGGERVGAWRRSRIHDARDVVAELDGLVRSWVLEGDVEPSSDGPAEPDAARARRVGAIVREALRSGAEVLRLEGDRLVLELPLPPEEAPYDGLLAGDADLSEDSESSHGVVASSWPFSTVEVVQGTEGQWLLRASTRGGWTTLTSAVDSAPSRSIGAGDEPPTTRRDTTREAVLAAGLTLGPEPDLDALKAFPPLVP